MEGCLMMRGYIEDVSVEYTKGKDLPPKKPKTSDIRSVVDVAFGPRNEDSGKFDKQQSETVREESWWKKWTNKHK
jgi:hypothetical protein